MSEMNKTVDRRARRLCTMQETISEVEDTTTEVIRTNAHENYICVCKCL